MDYLTWISLSLNGCLLIFAWLVWKYAREVEIDAKKQWKDKMKLLEKYQRVRNQLNLIKYVEKVKKND